MCLENSCAFFVRRRNTTQEPKDKDAVVAIEQALSELTKGLEGIQLLRVLERVSYENEVDVEHFDRWTRIRCPFRINRRLRFYPSKT